ncbi:MAG TPA: S53 family peptidase [Planktothrix sp.]|jgi:kumamolisin
MSDRFSLHRQSASNSVPTKSLPQAAHHADGRIKLQIVVGLKPRNQAELDALIGRQHDPRSVDYQHFLTVGEFTERFAPTPSRVDDVVRYLTANGITVEEVFANRLLIRASGTVKQLESTFKVRINDYTRPARLVASSVQRNSSALPASLSNDGEPAIPAQLNDVIESVIGLDTRTVLHNHIAYDDQPLHLASGDSPTATPPPGTPVTTAPPVATPPVATTPVPTPPVTTPPTAPPVPFQPALSPQQIASVYNFPNVNNKNVAARRYSGKGVNLAIATAEGYDPAEVETYWKTTGVRRTGMLTDVYVGGKAKPGDETTLDVELAGAQAPGANLMVYQAAAPALLFFTVTYARVVIDDKADVMTSSWGLCEEGTGPRMMATEGNILREAAVQGIAVFFSAGDDGAYDCGTKDPKAVQAVDYPSSSQYVTAVGGTSVHVSAFKRTDESVWKKGGGGTSKSVDLPLWQVAPTLPKGNLRSTTDVSIDADPHTGYMYLFKGKWENIGGTSAASPTWAALWTLVTQATGQRVGSAIYYVYRMGGLKEYNNLFFDVTQGDNGLGGPGFSAGPGWDIPSGWGTPNGVAITKWMISASPVKAPEDRQLGQKHPPPQAKSK